MSSLASRNVPNPVLGPARPASLIYRIARQLEAYAIAATPEQIGVLEGLRAATAIAAIVAAALWLQWPGLSWAAFGAFWTCLVDPGGPYRSRLGYMGSFAVAGAVAAALGSRSTDSERTPCAPWISTPSMSAVADGPVWNAA